MQNDDGWRLPARAMILISKLFFSCWLPSGHRYSEFKSQDLRVKEWDRGVPIWEHIQAVSTRFSDVTLILERDLDEKTIVFTFTLNLYHNIEHSDWVIRFSWHRTSDCDVLRFIPVPTTNIFFSLGTKGYFPQSHGFSSIVRAVGRCSRFSPSDPAGTIQVGLPWDTDFISSNLGQQGPHGNWELVTEVEILSSDGSLSYLDVIKYSEDGIHQRVTEREQKGRIISQSFPNPQSSSQIWKTRHSLRFSKRRLIHIKSRTILWATDSISIVSRPNIGCKGIRSF